MTHDGKRLLNRVEQEEIIKAIRIRMAIKNRLLRIVHTAKVCTF